MPEEQRLRAEISTPPQRAGEQDAAEDVQYGLEGMAGDAPAEHRGRRDRLARTGQGKARKLDDERARDARYAAARWIASPARSGRVRSTEIAELRIWPSGRIPVHPAASVRS